LGKIEGNGSVSPHGRIHPLRPSPPRRHRDSDWEGRLGREALPVAEPHVQGPLLQQRKLRQRVQDREVPRRRVQDVWRHENVLLQGGLLVMQSAHPPAGRPAERLAMSITSLVT
ncbi:hypothetical protein BAE44_0020208, partial [Dichanthelium oligosanthes]